MNSLKMIALIYAHLFQLKKMIINEELSAAGKRKGYRVFDRGFS